jgi:UDP-N-acetyl-D-mannosaminuronate dehydrogenase
VPLKDRIDSRTARVGVIGLGYVGLPLAVEFARAGFDVTGFDVDRAKVAEVNAGLHRSVRADAPARCPVAHVGSAGKITNGIDCAVVCTDHHAFDYPSMAARFPLVVDTRNALKGIDAANVFRL